MAMSRFQRLGVMLGVAWATADSLPDPHEDSLGIELSNVLDCGGIGGWEGAA